MEIFWVFICQHSQASEYKPDLSKRHGSEGNSNNLFSQVEALAESHLLGPLKRLRFNATGMNMSMTSEKSQQRKTVEPLKILRDKSCVKKLL